MHLAIGKRADGSDYLIEIYEDNLFISYVEDKHIKTFFDAIIEEACTNTQIILCSSSKKLTLNNSSRQAADSDAAILNLVHSEFKKRQKLTSDNNKEPFLVLIENIWDWVMLANRKVRSNKLIDLLTIAPDQKIFMICASKISLRNLLTQLIENNPKLEKRVANNKQRPIGALGAELVYTAEDFVFYKKKGDTDFERLY